MTYVTTVTHYSHRIVQHDREGMLGMRKMYLLHLDIQKKNPTTEAFMHIHIHPHSTNKCMLNVSFNRFVDTNVPHHWWSTTWTTTQGTISSEFEVIQDKAGITLHFSYCQQIPYKPVMCYFPTPSATPHARPKATSTLLETENMYQK